MFDPRRLIEALTLNNIKFIIVGGVAAKASTILFVTILLFPSLSHSENLFLEVEVQPYEVLVGAPIIFKLNLKSEGTFTLHGQLGLCDEHTKILVKDSSGNITNTPAFDCEGLSVIKGLFDSDAKKTYYGLVSTQDEMYLPAGEYKISAEYNSSGPYIDRYSDTDIRPVEGIWIGKLSSNEVKVTVKNPEGEDQLAFKALRPLQEKLEPPENKLSWFLKLEGKQILQDYPKSNYAAWVLWKNGANNYSGIADSPMPIDKEFDYKSVLEEIESSLSPYPCTTRMELLGVIEPWQKLIDDFQSFPKRTEALQGLAQAYIRNGEHEKAIPIIKELLEKYPESDEAKKVAEYKAWMQQKNIWN